MFIKAKKSRAKLRCAIYGVSGSGKTYSSLRIATGIASKMNNKIAVIDTEHGTSNKYSDKFDFDIAELINKNIDSYTEAIKCADNYDVLIIDSLSHAWQELLEDIDRLGKTKFRGNSWAAWSEGTPKQKKFVETILSSNCHIIATMRAKTEWVVSSGQSKSKIEKLGTAPEQRSGIEYEFDILLNISGLENSAIIEKDRSGKFQGKIIEKPGENFGIELFEWLNEGEEIKISDDHVKMIDMCKFKEELTDLYKKISPLYKNNLLTEIKDIFKNKALTFS